LRARALLAEARHFDPLADWADLVALVTPTRRDALRGLAKLAAEQRIAVEILVSCHRDLVASGDVSADDTSASSLPYALRNPLDASRDLDRTLTSYGLSPHPSVLLVVEGETEFVRLRERTGVPAEELEETLEQMIEAGVVERGGRGQFALTAATREALATRAPAAGAPVSRA